MSWYSKTAAKYDAFAPGRGWMDPSGRLFPIEKATETHEDMAKNILGMPNPPPKDEQEWLRRQYSTGEATLELYSMGWMRITPYGGGVLSANTTPGHTLSARQESSLKEQVEHGGMSYAIFDNGQIERKIWPEMAVHAAADVKTTPEQPIEAWHASKVKHDGFHDAYKTDLSSMGFHFGTEEQAKFRTKQYDFVGNEPHIAKYHLMIRNPLDVSHMASFAPDHLAEQMMGMGILTEQQFISIRNRYFDEPKVGRELVKILKKNGYDGLRYKNEREGEGYSYVPFDSAQIRPVANNWFASKVQKTAQGKANWICADCGRSTMREYYMLKDSVWNSVARSDEMLCIGCVEKRLGRRLTKNDFMEIPFNFDRNIPKTQRLWNRLVSAFVHTNAPSYLYRVEPKGNLDNVLRSGLWSYSPGEGPGSYVDAPEMERWPDQESEYDPQSYRLYFASKMWDLPADRFRIRIPTHVLEEYELERDSLKDYFIDTGQESKQIVLPSEMDIDLGQGQWVRGDMAAPLLQGNKTWKSYYKPPGFHGVKYYQEEAEKDEGDDELV